MAEDTFTLTVDELLNVDSDFEQNTIVMYPNPTYDIVHIEALPPEKGVLTITDMLGRIVFRKDVTKTIEMLDVSKLNAATYLVSISYEKSSYLRKLIVTK